MNPNDLSPAEQAVYRDVASELRCLVCQNQSLADSHASLAIDLKEKIAEQVHAGKSQAEIKQYMQDRYGEFVLYKPAYTPGNAVLWGGPFVVLLLAVLLARRVMKPRQEAPPTMLTMDDPDWAERQYQDRP
ncbi:cytochrome c-type biogenesis protein CcmH [Limnobacter humi]|uniref:Cytochrome c-type biogenesis protein n=1 Tax=Limnobacter humi TaxID=1778671 RepID=A0ABT1WFH1_9BURK|nr:cytochrome c-type biogenesis protein [Limnobacter humi]MCQ8896267.1 cytochrome c-type biogenesis protein CcmH [Limnobacter humi]